MKKVERFGWPVVTRPTAPMSAPPSMSPGAASASASVSVSVSASVSDVATASASSANEDEPEGGRKRKASKSKKAQSARPKLVAFRAKIQKERDGLRWEEKVGIFNDALTYNVIGLQEELIFLWATLCLTFSSLY